MKLDRRLVRIVLETLYEDFFPRDCERSVLNSRVLKKTKRKERSFIDAALQYLEDKDFVEKSTGAGGGERYRITALGIDAFEGEETV